MMANEDDNLLMEQVKKGDRAAFEELVVRHYRAGVIFACQIVRDYHTAEDIAQECFAKIYFLRDRYKPTFTFKTYLFTVIRNQSIDYVRKQRRSATVYWDESCSLETMQHVEEAFLADEEKKELYYYISNLKDEQKQLLYLYAIEGQSYCEIARILGQTIGQVKIKLFRCRQILKNKMGDTEQWKTDRKS